MINLFDCWIASISRFGSQTSKFFIFQIKFGLRLMASRFERDLKVQKVCRLDSYFMNVFMFYVHET